MPDRPAPLRRPPSRRIDTGFLRAFEAAARLGSFTAAAQELALTQSALSRQIQSIEDDIGVALFERSGPRVRLSEAGSQLAQVLAPALATLDHTVDALRRTTLRPRVRITTFASFASLWLMPRLPQFQAEHPEVDIAVEASDRLADLELSGDDVALRVLSIDNPLGRAPGSEPLFEEHFAPVCSPRLLADLGLPDGMRDLSDLARTTLIADVGSHNSPPHMARHISDLSWEGWFAAIGRAPVEPLSWLHLSYTHQAVQAALAGMGVAMGQMALVRHLIADGSLVLPLGPPQPSGYRYCLAQRTGQTARPEVAALTRWLQAQLQAQPEAGR